MRAGTRNGTLTLEAEQLRTDDAIAWQSAILALQKTV
tara:strand:+ start:310 stop:420 length:111 start_codon:yes stop_codon:yes gene_type:complete